jgi:hypothetical protein
MNETLKLALEYWVMNLADDPTIFCLTEEEGKRHLAEAEALLTKLPEETTASIGKWGIETFGKVRDPAAFIGRALEEMVELIDGCVVLNDFQHHNLDVLTLVANFLKDEAKILRKAYSAEEAADIRIFLEHFNYALGVDGQEEVDKKIAINRERTWNIDPKSGTAQHKETT